MDKCTVYFITSLHYSAASTVSNHLHGKWQRKTTTVMFVSPYHLIASEPNLTLTPTHKVSELET